MCSFACAISVFQDFSWLMGALGILLFWGTQGIRLGEEYSLEQFSNSQSGVSTRTLFALIVLLLKGSRLNFPFVSHHLLLNLVWE